MLILLFTICSFVLAQSGKADVSVNEHEHQHQLRGAVVDSGFGVARGSKETETATVGPYAQCGGQDYLGSTTCITGYACMSSDDYYSQCRPKEGPVSAGTVGSYGQCGGKHYSGSTMCSNDWDCVASDEYYWQCRPPTVPSSAYGEGWALQMLFTSDSNCEGLAAMAIDRFVSECKVVQKDGSGVGAWSTKLLLRPSDCGNILLTYLTPDCTGPPSSTEYSPYHYPLTCSGNTPNDYTPIHPQITSMAADQYYLCHPHTFPQVINDLVKDKLGPRFFKALDFTSEEACTEEVPRSPHVRYIPENSCSSLQTYDSLENPNKFSWNWIYNEDTNMIDEYWFDGYDCDPNTPSPFGANPALVLEVGVCIPGSGPYSTQEYSLKDSRTAPVITLTGLAYLEHEKGTPYTDLGATATSHQGLSLVVDSWGAVDVNTPGAYKIYYSAKDASGNPALSKTRTVIVGNYWQ